MAHAECISFFHTTALHLQGYQRETGIGVQTGFVERAGVGSFLLGLPWHSAPDRGHQDTARLMIIEARAEANMQIAQMNAPRVLESM
eukprot:637683-Pleurochrysis_carterae.AAC.1